MEISQDVLDALAKQKGKRKQKAVNLVTGPTRFCERCQRNCKRDGTTAYKGWICQECRAEQ